MTRKIALFIGLAIISTLIQGQNNLNPFLRSDLVKYSGTDVKMGISIKGDLIRITRLAEKYDFKIISSNNGYLQLLISPENINLLTESGLVDQIIYDPRQGIALNSQMLDHINADLVHTGEGVASTKGKGVIIGIIDTGIELDHPDFRDSLGNSRVIALWNQSDNANPGKEPAKFGYGSEWTPSEITNGQANVTKESHGTHVSGIAVGNGLATGNQSGVAPEADIIFVEWYTNGGKDWRGTIADGVQYIFDQADILGQPCVVNISLGSYTGSHDGLDPAALRIDSMLNAKNGRAVVCAAGNSGNTMSYHLTHQVLNDTVFTWFEYMQTSGFDFDLNGVADAGVFFESWADTADFSNLSFSFGADDLTGVGIYKGSSSFSKMVPGWNIDTIYNTSGGFLAEVQTYLELIDSRYWMVVGIPNPDSSQFTYRLTTTGTGQIDVWSCPSLTNSSQITLFHSVMSDLSYPGMTHLVLADSLQKIVDSWACSPEVVTVGNYVNRKDYIDFAGVIQSFNFDEGEIYSSSSSGPTRDGRVKPDICAPGTRVFSVATFFSIANDTILNPWAMSPDGYHKINTGTSMASPAVAGIGALFFENCPNASNSVFLDALINTAVTDSFTGSVPNFHYGYGKADAFQILKESVPTPKLDIGDTVICKSIPITPNTIYTDYLWSNGTLNSFITVSTSGEYFVRVDSLGCLGFSDTTAVVVNPYVLPQVSITNIDPIIFCSGDQCELQADPGFQFYTWSNGLGSTANVFAFNTGFYYYEAEDVDGCKSISDSILIVSNTSPPKPNIEVTGSVLESDVVANNYNWYLDGNIILSENQINLTVTQNGFYKVEVIHVNGCAIFSDPLSYTSTSTQDFKNVIDQVSISPNPSVNGQFYLSNFNQEMDMKLKMFNSIGQEVTFDFTANNQGLFIVLENSISGLYYLELSNNSQKQFLKLLIQ